MAIGIVYAEQSGIVRRIVIPDDDKQLPDHVGPGEALLTVDAKTAPDVFTATDLVAQATGKDIPTSRCAIVDAKGEVMGFIAADPALDVIDGHDIVTCHADGVKEGATYDAIGDKFTNPVTVIPAGTPTKDGTVSAVDVVVGGDEVINVKADEAVPIDEAGTVKK